MKSTIINIYYGLLIFLPLVILLFSLSCLSIWTPQYWKKNHQKHMFSIILFSIICFFLLPFHKISYIHFLLKDMLFNFLPFIICLLSYITIGSHVSINFAIGGIVGNILCMLIGSLITCFCGTTVATIIILPIIVKNNCQRLHSLVLAYLILIVSNISGAITTIGDPPLIMGFLKGIPFSWPTYTLASHSIKIIIFLLFLMTCCLYIYGEPIYKIIKFKNGNNDGIIQIKHKHCFILLILQTFIFYTYFLLMQRKMYFTATFSLLSLTITNLIFIDLKKFIKGINTKKWKGVTFSCSDKTYEINKELFIIFLCIFTCINLVFFALEKTSLLHKLYVQIQYYSNGKSLFWICGTMSAFLDNLPTYSLFFHLNGNSYTAIPLKTLKYISLGSVFGGALTYIGNAPNLIVKEYAYTRNIKIFSFFKYIVFACINLLIPFIIFI